MVKVPTQSVTLADGIASNTNHYDDLLPNPCGSTSSDTAKREATHISKFKIDVICLQEHRIINKDEIAK